MLGLIVSLTTAIYTEYFVIFLDIGAIHGFVLASIILNLILYEIPVQPLIVNLADGSKV